MTTIILISIFAIVLLLMIIGIVRNRTPKITEVRLASNKIKGKYFMASKLSDTDGKMAQDWRYYTDDGDEIFDEDLIYLLFIALNYGDLTGYDSDETLLLNDTNYDYPLESSVREPLTYEPAFIPTCQPVCHCANISKSDSIDHSSSTHNEIHTTHYDYCPSHDCGSSCDDSSGGSDSGGGDSD